MFHTKSNTFKRDMCDICFKIKRKPDLCAMGDQCLFVDFTTGVPVRQAARMCTRKAANRKETCRFIAPTRHPKKGKPICKKCHNSWNSRNEPSKAPVTFSMWVYWPGDFVGNGWVWSDPVTYQKLLEKKKYRQEHRPKLPITHVRNINWVDHPNGVPFDKAQDTLRYSMIKAGEKIVHVIKGEHKCAACKKKLTQSSYSGNQWQKTSSERRCKLCVQLRKRPDRRRRRLPIHERNPLIARFMRESLRCQTS